MHSDAVRKWTLLLALCIAFGGAGYAQESDLETPDVVQRRSDWFYQQRAYPLARIPAGIRQEGLRRLQQMVREQALIRSAQAPGENIPPPTSTQWQAIGPQPTTPPAGALFSGVPNGSGRVAALAVDPRSPSVVYLGGAQGGVWKTTNGGAAWIPLTDTQPSLAIGSIALAPSNPDIVYVGTGEQNQSSDSYYGAGILKSTDGGANWTQLGAATFAGPFSSGNSSGGAHIGAIAVHPTNPNIVLAAAQRVPGNGVFRSTDGGSTWINVLPGTVFQVVFDPASPNLAYTAIVNSAASAGFYQSTDSGQTWTLLSTFGLVRSTIGRIAFAVAPSNPATIYAAVPNSSGSALQGVFKSVDHGSTFALTAVSEYCAPQCWYDNVVAVNPTDPNYVVFGGSLPGSGKVGAFLRTTDGGVTVSDIAGGTSSHLHVDHHAIAFSANGSTIYAGNDGGVWSASTAGPISWTSLNPTLALTQFYPGVSIHPTNVNFIVGGTQDNGTQRYAGNLAWEEVNCGDGGYTAIDFNVPTTIYAACGGGSLMLQKSTANGDGPSWTSASTGILSSDGASFIPPMAMDPSNSSRLYYGTFRLYQTTNGAGLWTPISNDLTSGGGTITAIGVSPTDPNTVWVGTNDAHVQFTRNAVVNPANAQLATFTSVVSGLPPRQVTAITVSPRNGVAYVGFSGFSGFGDNLGHIFSITLNGTTPTVASISSTLPNTPVNNIVVDPDVDNTLYIATDVGVFYTTNAGASWSPLVSGLPRVAVLGLAFHRSSRTLRAGTHGRSMWEIVSPVSAAGLLPSLGSLVPANAVSGGSGFTLTVNGSNFVSGASVQWNGAARSTNFVNSGQLTAAITANDISGPSTPQVTVLNPAGGGLSNALAFTITASVPVLTSVSPATAVAGGAAFTLTVTGTGFAASSVVQWNGLSRTTTFVNSSQLTAAIPASDITGVGTPAVTVSTPGGGTSTGVSFFVTASNVFPFAQLRYWPHIVTGNGYVTKMTITNLTNAQNSVGVYFVNQAGALTQSVGYSLPAAGTVRFATDESARFTAPTTKWAIINSQAAVTINLFFEVILNPATGVVANTLGFNDSPALADFTMPVEFQPASTGFRTVGIACANVNGSAVTISMELIDQGGNIIGSANLNPVSPASTGPLAAFGQTGADLQGTFGGALPQANFIGSLTVHATSPVSCVGLEDDLGLFSATPPAPGRAK